jgi:hypothetical protein
VPPTNLGPAACIDHPHGVWFTSLPATEFAMASWRYDMTLALLVLREAVSAARSAPAVPRRLVAVTMALAKTWLALIAAASIGGVFSTPSRVSGALRLVSPQDCAPP